MGLDMFAYASRTKPSQPADFDLGEHEDAAEIAYWRKHPNLQGWMEQLYREKNGKAESFNVVPVELTLEDLDRLEKDILEGNLPATGGFFFGENSDDYYRKNDLAFIETARAAIENGESVYYYSWW